MRKQYLVEIDDASTLVQIRRLIPMEGPTYVIEDVQAREPILSLLVVYEMKMLEQAVAEGEESDR